MSSVIAMMTNAEGTSWPHVIIWFDEVRLLTAHLNLTLLGSPHRLRCPRGQINVELLLAIMDANVAFSPSFFVLSVLESLTAAGSF